MSTPQAPIGSGFGAATTAAEILRGRDLSGKVAIVTGGYSGIGRETARELRAAGARVIVPTRDRGRAAAALSGLDVEIEVMDLLDPPSIDTFAARFLASGSPLHILVNSAGIMACPLTRDGRGYEAQFSTNHLGHFQLAARLLPALRRANGARVVSVSSWGHRRSPVVFEDPNFERREYERWSAYGQSKTANILFALALDQRAKGDGIRAFSLLPGAIVDTGLGKHMAPEELRAMGVLDEHGRPIVDPSRNLKNVEQGAATSVWCATSPQLDGMGGVYCENCDIAPPARKEVAESRPAATPGTLGVVAHAVDPVAGERLWELSERLVGLKA
jgi:NAD(P)-dependent dehydrogenase (short-subunit alcohol dehydrogenase family)